MIFVSKKKLVGHLLIDLFANYRGPMIEKNPRVALADLIRLADSGKV